MDEYEERFSKVRESRRGGTQPAVTPDEYGEQLIVREQELILRYGEAGYVSPFHIGFYRPYSAASVEDYWSWRNARTDWVVTGDTAYLTRMTDCVTMDNPPLAADFTVKPTSKTVNDRSKVRRRANSVNDRSKVRRRANYITAALIAYIIIVVMIGIF